MNVIPIRSLSTMEKFYSGVNRHLVRWPQGEQVIKEQANAARW